MLPWCQWITEPVDPQSVDTGAYLYSHSCFPPRANSSFQEHNMFNVVSNLMPSPSPTQTLSITFGKLLCFHRHSPIKIGTAMIYPNMKKNRMILFCFFKVFYKMRSRSHRFMAKPEQKNEGNLRALGI